MEGGVGVHAKAVHSKTLNPKPQHVGVGRPGVCENAP